jgi:hypothetical protein
MVIVLDCNIWIRLALNRQLDLIADLSDSFVDIASCSELRAELTDVLSRPKFTKFIPDDYAEKIAEFHDLVTRTFETEPIDKVVTDEKDNYLFSLCRQSGAEYLVTGDKLLLKVIRYNETKVVTLALFKRILDI